MSGAGSVPAALERATSSLHASFDSCSLSVSIVSRSYVAEPTSCVGSCERAVARAIPGGGYCWCTGCDYKDGRCCPDFEARCGVGSWVGEGVRS